MLSKSQISFIKSLHQKKFRKEHNLFIAEGIKSITEFILSDYRIENIFCTAHTIPKLDKLLQKIKVQEITDTELKKISALIAPQDALATIHIPQETEIAAESVQNLITLVLDDIQDPGNLGTIIRTADWFGFKQIICSAGTVDAYNPKVVQATMGSLARIRLHYVYLPDFLKSNNYPVFGALLEGNSVYDIDFSDKEGILILGNEGRGISPELKEYITDPITIPQFGKAESLNVAVSAGILCSEIKRNSAK
jgi:TrmH family RNA methyltransferase